jgi:glycosyltransferase involved in cell wall biosynthesis
LLHVGSTVPRKNIEGLLRVVAAVRHTIPRVRLVRVGGELTAAQECLARDLGVFGAILSLPSLDTRTLAAVYRRATVLLLPSVREGFGLPMLEALASGTPVIASDIPALREVGGTAAVYCPVHDTRSWRDATLKVVSEGLSHVGPTRRGLARVPHASRYTWARYAAQMVRLYRVLGSNLPQLAS